MSMTNTERRHQRQPRENAVPCRVCIGRTTWDPDAVCDVCKADALEAVDHAAMVAADVEFDRYQEALTDG